MAMAEHIEFKIQPWYEFKKKTKFVIFAVRNKPVLRVKNQPKSSKFNKREAFMY